MYTINRIIGLLLSGILSAVFYKLDEIFEKKDGTIKVVITILDILYGAHFSIYRLYYFWCFCFFEKKLNIQIKSFNKKEFIWMNLINGYYHNHSTGLQLL